MKISEKKALEILQKDFATLREQAKIAAATSTFILQRSEILFDRIAQLVATQSEPATRTPLPNGNPGGSETELEHEKPLTLS